MFDIASWPLVRADDHPDAGAALTVSDTAPLRTTPPSVSIVPTLFCNAVALTPLVETVVRRGHAAGVLKSVDASIPAEANSLRGSSDSNGTRIWGADVFTWNLHPAMPEQGSANASLTRRPHSEANEAARFARHFVQQVLPHTAIESGWRPAIHFDDCGSQFRDSRTLRLKSVQLQSAYCIRRLCNCTPLAGLDPIIAAGQLALPGRSGVAIDVQRVGRRIPIMSEANCTAGRCD